MLGAGSHHMDDVGDEGSGVGGIAGSHVHTKVLRMIDLGS